MFTLMDRFGYKAFTLGELRRRKQPAAGEGAAGAAAAAAAAAGAGAGIEGYEIIPAGTMITVEELRVLEEEWEVRQHNLLAKTMNVFPL
jgi:hypothetical protein